MELRLDRLSADLLDQAPLPAGFTVHSWSRELLPHHANIKFESFRDEIDAHVFPCLGDKIGCRNLMREISNRKNFVPEATWLACRQSDFVEGLQPCGTVQGLMSSAREGAIQNLGVHPDCRDCGLGKALLFYALDGFRRANCRYVNLEVTVENDAAIRLYERCGFRRTETLYKVAEVEQV